MRVAVIESANLCLASYGALLTVKAIKGSGHEPMLIGSSAQEGIEDIWEFKRDLLYESLLRFGPEVGGYIGPQKRIQ